MQGNTAADRLQQYEMYEASKARAAMLRDNEYFEQQKRRIYLYAPHPGFVVCEESGRYDLLPFDEQTQQQLDFIDAERDAYFKQYYPKYYKK